MSSSAITSLLPHLTPREAVADTMHRCVLGIDTNNKELFESAMSKDPSATFIAGPATFTGWSEISSIFEAVWKVTTLHQITNMRVCLADEKTEKASLTCHCISYHVRPEDAFDVRDTSYTAGSLYDVEVVKDDGDQGLWKILHWRITVLWTTGERGVLHGEGSKLDAVAR